MVSIEYNIPCVHVTIVCFGKNGVLVIFEGSEILETESYIPFIDNITWKFLSNIWFLLFFAHFQILRVFFWYLSRIFLKNFNFNILWCDFATSNITFYPILFGFVETMRWNMFGFSVTRLCTQYFVWHFNTVRWIHWLINWMNFDLDLTILLEINFFVCKRKLNFMKIR